MEGQFTATQVATDVNLQQELISFLNDQQRGGFCYIHGYISKTGEVANHWFQGACLYGNMVKRSVDMLDGEIHDKIKADGLEVTRGVWVGADGSQHTKKAGDRTFEKITKVYSLSNEDDAAKIMTAIHGGIDPNSDKAVKGLRENLTAPKKVDQGYTVEAKGTYSKEGEADGILYFRDSMYIHKHVQVQGEFKNKATGEIVAIKDAIKRMFPVSRYRAYKLADNFEYITVGGLSILQGADSTAFELSLVETSVAKDAIYEESSKVLADKIMA